jgi:hypothetical protein
VPAPIVYDINVLVTAAATGNSPFRSWPSPPPVSGNASADCGGVANDAAEFSLWLSPHIMRNIDRILSELFKWELAQIDAYLTALVAIAQHSGGEVIVSNDVDLISMSPWRGTPIVTPEVFRQKVDGMRRHARRRR